MWSEEIQAWVFAVALAAFALIEPPFGAHWLSAFAAFVSGVNLALALVLRNLRVHGRALLGLRKDK